MLELGIKGEQFAVVNDENTAEKYLSGLLPVFATPALVALMEFTCQKSVQPFLDDGFGTVGSAIECRHTAPSPIGSTIKCISELIEIDGRRLVFSVKASDDQGSIGEAKHERFIIDNERFMKKVNEKQAALDRVRGA